MICPSETNKVLFSGLLPLKYPQVMRRLEAVLRRNLVSHGFIQGTAGEWARDYMPIQVDGRRFVQFTYTPDYLKDYPELRTRPGQWQIDPQWQTGGRWLRSRLVIDGGNVVAGPGGTVVLTDKIYRENPRWNRKRLRERLRQLLGATKLIVIPKEPFDLIGHADGLLWFASERRVLVNDYSKLFPAYRRRLLDKLKSAKLEVVEIPYCPPPEQQPFSAMGCYVNMLQVGNLVIVPAYGRAEDSMALRTVKQASEGHFKVVSLRCNEIAVEGGCWNCVSWAYRMEDGCGQG